jgi:glycosyltransferase involved in cell wall biosynthesis
MPNSLLEAMAAGVPAIAFAIPPLLEIDSSERALITVQPCDSAALGVAILDLLSSVERRNELARHARELVETRFMISRNMQTAAEILSRVKRRGFEIG